MKKALSLLLCLATILSVVVSCSEKETTSEPLNAGVEIESGNYENFDNNGDSEKPNSSNTQSTSKDPTSSGKNNTSSKNPTTPDKEDSKDYVKLLDKLVKAIPATYDRFLSRSGSDNLYDLLDEIDSEGKLTNKKAKEFYTRLKEAVDSPSYAHNDIDAIYLDYNGTPSKGGGYINAYIAVVDVDKGLTSVVEDSKSQCKVRGNTTADFPKTPYNIKFSTARSVLGMSTRKTWCLLANAFDKSLMRNAIAFSFARSIGVKGTSDYRFVDLYVNGKYMGNYILVEKISDQSVGINVDKDEFLLEIAQPIYKVEPDTNYVEAKTPEVRFEINEPDPITKSQMAKLQKYIDTADTAIASGKMSEIKKYIDVDSFVNFYIANEYLKMLDFHFSSPRFYIKGGKIYAGPIWDFDLSMGNANIDYEPYIPYMNGDGEGQSYQGLWVNRVFGWYKALMKNPDFKKLVKARYTEVQPQIVNLYQDNKLGKCLIDSLFTNYYDSFNRNFNEAGWTFNQKGYFELQNPPQSYSENVDLLRTWLENRNKWLLNEFSKY